MWQIYRNFFGDTPSPPGGYFAANFFALFGLLRVGGCKILISDGLLAKY
jgi:hypothetical protein